MLIGAAKITDFPPLSEDEFKGLATQIQTHLSKGIPSSAAVQGLPLDALCRVLRTIMVLGQQSEQALTLFKEIFESLEDDVANHNAIKMKLAPYVLRGEDLTDFLSERSPLIAEGEGNSNE